jgi:hypothetical protein
MYEMETVETYRGHEISRGVSYHSTEYRYWFTPAYLCPRGVMSEAATVERARAMIDRVHEIMAVEHQDFPEHPAVGMRFIDRGHYGWEPCTIELVRGNVVVFRHENGSQSLWIDRQSSGAFGGAGLSAEDFLQAFIDREEMFSRCNAIAARDAKIEGHEPLIL